MLLLILFASIVLICKSLWIKASAKWLNVKSYQIKSFRCVLKWTPWTNKHLEHNCHESGCLSPHYNCTSPMDYNSHHSLHYNTHIPIHHCTNHTAVTSHSLALIVLPHLIHSPTYKQHTSLHTLRSLVLAPADISERLPFPLIATSVFDPGLPYLGTLNLCLWPRPLPGIVYVSALPLIFLLLPADHCLFDSASV